MGLLVNLDGVIASTGSVSVLDRGFLYGDGVYEVVRTFRGRPFGLDEHLTRLRQSAAYLYMDVPWSDTQIKTEVERTLKQAGNDESYIRIVITRGAEDELSLLPGDDIEPSLTIIVRPIAQRMVLSETGVHLQVSERLRTDQRALTPAAKTGNYLNNILALIEARRGGADDALLLNGEGEVTEATTSNFWFVRDGIVHTPPTEAGILHGITRYFLLQLLRERSIPHCETSLRPGELQTAEEAFLSSSVRLLMPVARIDDHVLPCCPGPLTRLLWEGLLEGMEAGVQAVPPLR